MHREGLKGIAHHKSKAQYNCPIEMLLFQDGGIFRVSALYSQYCKQMCFFLKYSVVSCIYITNE